MSFFGKSVDVLRRSGGAYTKGQWVQGIETPDTIKMTIQPATILEYETVRPLLGNRMPSKVLRGHTKSKLQSCGEQFSGDVVLHAGGRWVVAGEADRHVLQSSVSHYRYLLVPENELTTGDISNEPF